MKKTLVSLALGLLALLAGCNKEASTPQPTGPRLAVVRGDQQTAKYGEWLPDSIVLQVAPAATPSPMPRYVLTYKLRVGNGLVGTDNTYLGNLGKVPVDAHNRARVRWSLGCNSPQQQLTFYLFAANCPAGTACLPLDSVSVGATAQRPSGWSRACGTGALTNAPVSDFCPCAGALYALRGGVAYASSDEGVNWRPLASPVPNESIQFLRCNRQGALYVALQSSGIYTSTNQGASWTALNNGILDHRYPLDLVVEDQTVFVSFMFDGLYRTTTNGTSWHKLLIDGKYHEEYSHLVRHPNGSLYIFDKWGVLFKSVDEGDTWQKQPTSYQYISTPVYDMAVDRAGNLVVASSYDGYVSVLNPATLTGSVAQFYSPETHTSSYISQLTPFQDALYFLVLGTSSPGVYAGTPGSYALASAGFDKPISSFYVRADKSLLLASTDGLFYFAK